jgi:hypothetical protein
MDKKTIIAEIKRIAQEKGLEQMTRIQFTAESGISERQIYQVFDSWREACEMSGVQPYMKNIPIDDNTLFEEMRRVFISNGDICTRMKFSRLSKYDASTYNRRFGAKWKDVLLSFKEWLEQNKIEFPFIEKLAPEKQTEIGENIEPSQKIQTKTVPHWQRKGGTAYGPFLNFRGLQHAPINEQGVVFLFGMICFEIGFVVEAVGTGYPDCEAKRRIDKSRDKWERVKIEFEYLSSHFKDHGHNPKLCDVIVCWEHNWPDCPLEVIELRSAIQTLNE